MPAFYSPSGNFELWEIKPDGYLTAEEWNLAHPADLNSGPILTECIETKCAEIRAHSDELINQLQIGYSAGEVNTFEQQYAGACDIIAGNTATEKAQFVIALIAIRIGTTPTAAENIVFAERIQSNYLAAKAATIQIVGTQQNLELQVRACTTVDEVLAINWPAA